MNIYFDICNTYNQGTSLVAKMVKRLPATRETWVQSLGQEDPLEKEMATHSSTLALKIPWMEEPGRLVLWVTKGRTQLSDFTSQYVSIFILNYENISCLSKTQMRGHYHFSSAFIELLLHARHYHKY